MEKNIVRVTILGGVAEVTQKPKGVTVVIKDLDLKRTMTIKSDKEVKNAQEVNNKL